MKATQTKRDFSDRIWSLFQREKYEQSRALLTKELIRAPNDHWLITQLGVTFYERREYDEALVHFRRSREVLGDCPLTLWNLAGVLDAMGRCSEAIETYSLSRVPLHASTLPARRPTNHSD